MSYTFFFLFACAPKIVEVPVQDPKLLYQAWEFAEQTAVFQEQCDQLWEIFHSGEYRLNNETPFLREDLKIEVKEFYTWGKVPSPLEKCLEELDHY